jgi:hypothetical protein
MRVRNRALPPESFVDLLEGAPLGRRSVANYGATGRSVVCSLANHSLIFWRAPGSGAEVSRITAQPGDR